MQDLHSMCVDKSSYKAEQDNGQLHLHALTKDSFKKAYEQSQKKHAASALEE